MESTWIRREYLDGLGWIVYSKHYPHHTFGDHSFTAALIALLNDIKCNDPFLAQLLGIVSPPEIPSSMGFLA